MFDYGDIAFVVVLALCFGFMAGYSLGFKEGKREGFIRGKISARSAVIR